MFAPFDAVHFAALFQIILIDLSLAADNAIVIGMAVMALPKEQRKMATLFGIAMATVLRIVMAIFAVEMLRVTGLLLAGGLLLAWVSWKMFREFQDNAKHRKEEASENARKPAAKKMSDAVWQIVIADVSMSLDNVLAVAGAARDHLGLLVIGLTLSVVLMGVASAQIAKLTHKYPWVALVGIAIIVYTAGHMIFDGGKQLGLWAAV